MIRGCIVEDHCDVVPFLLKQCKAKAAEAGAPVHEPRVLVHYDAHPDLSLNPDTSQAQCLRLADMVQHLQDSSGGIAEFILPLFYCEYLSRCIWVKPHWATQLRAGEYVFALGVERSSGRMRVDCCEDYYLDEEVVVAGVEELDDVKMVSVCVVDETDAPEQLPAMLRGTSWVFDCCLDFFTCANPFVDELAEAGVSQEDIGIIQALFRNAPHRGIQRQSSTRRKLVETAAKFNQLLSQLFQSREQEQERNTIATDMKHLFSMDTDSAIVDQFVAVLEMLTPDQIEMIEEARYCINLPHFITGPDEQTEMLERIRNTMLAVRDHPPGAVTISRSTTDGFTPEDDTERLQHAVAAMLSDCFCPVQIARLHTDDTVCAQNHSNGTDEILPAEGGRTTTGALPQHQHAHTFIRLFDIREDPLLHSHFANFPSSLNKRKLSAANISHTWHIEQLQPPNSTPNLPV